MHLRLWWQRGAMAMEAGVRGVCVRYRQQVYRDSTKGLPSEPVRGVGVGFFKPYQNKSKIENHDDPKKNQTWDLLSPFQQYDFVFPQVTTATNSLSPEPSSIDFPSNFSPSTLYLKPL